MENLMDVENVSKIYREGGEEVRALDGVSLQVAEGEFLAIVGQSGSGKSTLMNLLGCLDSPTSGTYRLSGTDVSRLSENQLAEIRNREIGFVFQSFNLIQTMSALENVELPLQYRGMGREERRRLSEEALCRVGLSRRLHHRPGQMSGGQQQRVAIARAIAARPPIILADEPTGNLDSRSGNAVMDVLKELNGEGRTVVLITHDARVAAAAHRILRIQDGRITD